MFTLSKQTIKSRDGRLDTHLGSVQVYSGLGFFGLNISVHSDISKLGSDSVRIFDGLGLSSDNSFILFYKFIFYIF